MKNIFFDTIPSTNLYLKENYETLENMTVICARHQTEGRGRKNRKWVDGNDLLFSILIKNDLELATNYSLLIAYSIRKVLSKHLNDVTIKWPNDIMVHDYKVCGILLEAVTKNKIECVIIGVGINTNTESFSEELKVKANSLKNLLDTEIDNQKLLLEIEEEFEKDLELLSTNIYIKEINKYFYLQDKPVEFAYEGKEQKGIVLKMNNDGSIAIKTEKEIININYGEVSLSKSYKVK